MILGIYFVNTLNEETFKIIFKSITTWKTQVGTIHLNNILMHLMVESLLLVLSSYIVGMPLNVSYILYNGFTIGFTIECLFKSLGFSGLIYGIIYTIITKGIFIMLLIILLITYNNLSTKIYLKYLKKDFYAEKKIDVIIKKSFLIIFLIFINDLIIYIFGGKVLNIFNFLIN